MKKLLILLCLFPLLLQGQILNTAPPYLQKSTAAPAGGYCAEYQAVYDYMAMTTPPSADIAGHENDFVVAAKAHGYWTKLDWFVFFANEINTAGEALINWADPGNHSATLTGTVAWTSLQGVNTVTAGSFVDSNWNPTVDSVNFGKNHASFGVYSRTDATSDSPVFGNSVTAENLIILRSSGGNFKVCVNSATLDYDAVANTLGFFVAVRTSSTNEKSYQNGSPVSNITRTSTAVPNDTFKALRVRSIYDITSYQISSAFIGGLLTAAEIADFNTDLETLMDALGTGVE